jgi:MFS family permease
VLTTLPLSAVFLVIFIYVEDQVASEPMIPVRLLLDRTVGSACLTNWFGTMATFGLLYYTPVYFQVQGYSPTASGVRLVPEAIGTSMGSLVSGIVMRWTGRYVMLSAFCMSLMLAATAAICTFTLTSPAWLAFVCLFVLGVGYGAMLTITLVALIAAVDHRHHSVATSASYAFRSTGGTIGITIASAVFQNVLQSSLWSRFDGRKEAATLIPKLRDSLDEIWKVPADWRQGVLDAYMDALRAIFITLCGISVLATLVSMGMKQHKLHSNLARR